ncbi:c-type cytochrome [Aquabacter spiritensis]|uniref:c-type cytochrome n=1 Tax=Aquabacter spiritensis TaxID=933073 RepID=UPI001A9D11BF|nr:c-type cytochrome [Aquabacter spiritensis]
MPAGRQVADGDPARGHVLVRSYGCQTCHAIPGVAGVKGVVGPPLDRFARRAMIAGLVPNEPAVLLRWLENPPQISPRTAMPDMGVSRADARDIAAYLYSLE